MKKERRQKLKRKDCKMVSINEKFKPIKEKAFEIFRREVNIKENTIDKYDKVVHILKIIVVERKPEVKE